jgi:hypothetical protein
MLPLSKPFESLYLDFEILFLLRHSRIIKIIIPIFNASNKPLLIDIIRINSNSFSPILGDREEVEIKGVVVVITVGSIDESVDCSSISIGNWAKAI